MKKKGISVQNQQILSISWKNSTSIKFGKNELISWISNWFLWMVSMITCKVSSRNNWFDLNLNCILKKTRMAFHIVGEWVGLKGRKNQCGHFLAKYHLTLKLLGGAKNPSAYRKTPPIHGQETNIISQLSLYIFERLLWTFSWSPEYSGSSPDIVQCPSCPPYWYLHEIPPLLFTPFLHSKRKWKCH